MTTAQPKLNNYVFTGPIGSGSYATVYKAYKKVGFTNLVLFSTPKESILKQLI